MPRLAPITPGELLQEEFLEPLGISQYRLAKAIGVSNFSCALVMDLLKTCKGVARSKLSA